MGAQAERVACIGDARRDGVALTVSATDPFYADHLRVIKLGYDMQPGYLFEGRVE